MQFSTAIAAAILAFSPAAMAATMTVQVGQNNKLTFQPNAVTMNVGDQLVFQFDNAVRPNKSILSLSWPLTRMTEPHCNNEQCRTAMRCQQSGILWIHARQQQHTQPNWRKATRQRRQQARPRHQQHL